MSEISAPPPPPPLPPAGSTPAPPPTAITLPPAQAPAPIPDAILQAVIGTRFEVQVISLSNQGILDLQTPAGRLQLQIQLPLALAAGDQLTIQLNGKGPQFQFIIAAINGKNPTVALRAAVGQAAAGTGAPSGLTNAGPLPVLAPGSLATATLLRPAPGIPAPGFVPGQAVLPASHGSLQPPGSQPGGFPTPGQAQSPPGATSQPGQSPPGPGNPGLPGTTAPAGTHGTAAARPAVLGAGTQFTVRIAEVHPPPPGGGASVIQAHGPGTPPLALGQTLPGVVSTATAGGHPIVETPLGPIALATAAPPPPAGTRVVLEVTSAPLPPAPPTPLMDSQQLFLRQALFADRQWPALNEAVEALEHAAPNAAVQMLHTALPRPDANLAANLMFFLAALRGGDLRSWLGDAPSRALQKINPALSTRLRDDLRQISRLADDAPGSDWRTVLVPFHDGERLDQIRLLTRRQDQEEEKDADGGPGTRFVVDVTLSRLGHIQLDGLVDPGHRRLDMVVRSDARLPSTVQNDIRRLYEEAGAITGYRGGVGFQAQPAGFVEIAPPPVEGGLGLFV